ncbi:MAG: hypothetical protein SFW67_31360 [Myxococcaceae bacterium]|nr:hypothetical protein [Myxococcaceae bacterium]
MNQKMLQTLFILSWGAWACMPLWGAAAFLAVQVLLLVGLSQESAKARSQLEADAALATLEPEARRFLEAHALFYAAPASAKAWSNLFRAVSLALLLLVPAFAAHAFLRRDLWLLLPLVPAILGVAFNGSRARPLELDEWVKEPAHAAELPHHQAIKAALTSKLNAALAAVGASLGPGSLRPPPGL